jgi:hypothetical protein
MTMMSWSLDEALDKNSEQGLKMSGQRKFGETRNFDGPMLPREDRSGDGSVHTHVAQNFTQLPRRDLVPEMRRKDVGQQMYPVGTPTLPHDRVDRNGVLKNDRRPETARLLTGFGPVVIESTRKDEGSLPSAGEVDFLRHAQGSRLPVPPDRYYK